jgi:glutaredoxin
MTTASTGSLWNRRTPSWPCPELSTVQPFFLSCAQRKFNDTGSFPIQRTDFPCSPDIGRSFPGAKIALRTETTICNEYQIRQQERDDGDHTILTVFGSHTALLILCSKLEGRDLAGLESPRMPEGHSVIVYSRKGCHLCEVVKESLTKLSRRGSFTWREIDVDSDPELRRQYNDEVPVVFINGRKAFKYHMDEQEFLRKLSN